MDPAEIAVSIASPEEQESKEDTVNLEAVEPVVGEHDALPERAEVVSSNASPAEEQNAEAAEADKPAAASSSGWGFSSGFSWGKVMESGGKMMQTVKKQTEGVIDIYRKDISDLVQVVSSETSHLSEKLKPVVVSTTGTVVENLKSIVFEDSDEEDEEPTEFEKAIEERVGRIANSAGKVAHNFTERLTNLVNQAVKIKGADDDKKKSKKLIYDPKQAIIAALRADPATFLEDPREEGTPTPNEVVADESNVSPLLQRAETRFQTFRANFNIAEYAGQISRILNEDAEMKRMLERIVPAQASYEQFWERYFFKIAEIDVQEARRKALMQGVQAADEEDFNWDEDEENDNADEGGETQGETEKTGGSPDTEPNEASPKADEASPKSASVEKDEGGASEHGEEVEAVVMEKEESPAAESNSQDAEVPATTSPENTGDDHHEENGWGEEPPADTQPAESPKAPAEEQKESVSPQKATNGASARDGEGDGEENEWGWDS